MGLGAAYIVASACIGYFVCSSCYRFKYDLARKSGYYSYLHCTTFGVIFLILGMILASWEILLVSWFPINLDILKNLEASQRDFVGNLISATLTAYVFAKITNLFIDKSAAIQIAWKDDLSVLLSIAIAKDQPIQISLENRKVYVGQVFDTVEPNLDNSYLTILPFLGGHRSEDTLQLRLTHRYEKILDDVDASENQDIDLALHRLVIPKSKITTCHVFDFDIHNDVITQQAGH